MKVRGNYWHPIKQIYYKGYRDTETGIIRFEDGYIWDPKNKENE